MKILGIDPGYAIVGFGAVETSRGVTRMLTHGAITTKAHTPMPERLSVIFHETGQLLDMLRPDAVAIEQLFFNTNTTTAIEVAQARGVILLACAERGISIYEYPPLQVKQAVVGYGRAEKQQVMEMTRVMLKLDKIPKPDDAADALALALCHASVAGSLLSRIKG